MQDGEPLVRLTHIFHIHVLEEEIEVGVDQEVVHLDLTEAGHALDHVGQELVLGSEPLLLQPDRGEAERDLDRVALGGSRGWRGRGQCSTLCGRSRWFS